MMKRKERQKIKVKKERRKQHLYKSSSKSSKPQSERRDIAKYFSCGITLSPPIK